MLDFGVEQVEIDHQKFDEVSITWNTIDPNRAIINSDSGFDLVWRPEPMPQLGHLTGRILDHAELLEWTGHDMAQGSIAIGFDFTTAWLTVLNALDENGLEHHIPGQVYQRHLINSVT